MTGDPSDAEPGDDPADDLIGVTSARLRAAGLAPAERARALTLLSILGTVADADLRVRRPLAMVASEFDLPFEEARRSLDALAAAGAVRRGQDGLVLTGREPSRHVAMSLHAFLDAATELDEVGGRRHRRRTLVRPSGALAAAAIVALALLAPSAVRGPTSTVATTRAEPPALPDPAGARPRPGPSTGGSAPSSTAMPTTGTPAGTMSEGSPTPTTTTTLVCPAGGPVLEVLGTAIGADGRLAVDGVARNATTHDLLVRSFTVRTTVGGEEVSGPGTVEPVAVPARSSTVWTAVLAVPGLPGPVEAVLGDWDWGSDPVSQVCPSP